MKVFAKCRAPYPRFYWYRGRGGSDRDWILARMAIIPDGKKCEVAEEYERLFLSDRKSGRKLANEYLHELASEYRDARKIAA